MEQSLLNQAHISQNIAKETAKKLSKLDKPTHLTRSVRIDDKTTVETRLIHLTDEEVRQEYFKNYKRSADIYTDEAGNMRVK